MREMQETSIIAYHEIIEENLLGKRQILIYGALRDLGEATDYEIAKFLERPDPNFVRPRRKELADYGLVVESQKRKCNVTGRLAIAWKVKKKTKITPILQEKINKNRRQKTLASWVEELK